MATASVRVAKSASFWQPSITYAPAEAKATLEADLLAADAPRRWSWSAEDLPRATRPAEPPLLTPNWVPAVASAPAARTAPARPPARWEIWDGDQLWHA
jgi:hypothetical protein